MLITDPVINVSAPGYAARPPSFDTVKLKPAPQPVQADVISDGRVPSPAERGRRFRPDMSKISNAHRRDFVRAQQLARHQALGSGRCRHDDVGFVVGSNAGTGRQRGQHGGLQCQALPAASR